MRRSRARRATSRRIGSNDERRIASGVSSMMMSTPVAASTARMFRPSRPMIRPFMSSDGRSRTDTVVSTTCSDAMRWIVIERRRFAFQVPLGLLGRQARDLLELLALLGDDLLRLPLRLGLDLLDPLLALREVLRAILGFQLALLGDDYLLVEGLFLQEEALFLVQQLG